MNLNIGMFRGDITKVRVDAVVNAANNSLVGGYGVDGAIHDAAGPKLLAATMRIGWCETGDCVATPGFRLPAKYVLHTVGPVWHGGRHHEAALLNRCYWRCLDKALSLNLKSVAFPCVSAGVFRFPKRYACRIAVNTTIKWLAYHKSDMRVMFVVFDEENEQIYSDYLDAACVKSSKENNERSNRK